MTARSIPPIARLLSTWRTFSGELDVGSPKTFGPELTKCGPDCLYGCRQFVGFVPRSSPERGVLLQTDLDTLVKPKKYRSTEQIWGATVIRDLSSRKQAFASIRANQPKGVLIPLTECDCAYEVPIVFGAPVLQRLNSPSDAERFVLEARLVLAGLHQLGIRHGDPGHHNFLITRCGPCLIDLDHVNVGSKIWAQWELRKFLRDTVFPLLGRKRALYFTLHHCINHGYLAALTTGALSQALRRGRSRILILQQIFIIHFRRRIIAPLQ